MIHKKSLKIIFGFVPVVLAIVFLTGCAAKMKVVNPWGDMETGLILQYRMQDGQVLKYETSSETKITQEVMDQSVEVEMNGSSTFSVKSKGQKENNLRLGITIEAMDVGVFGPQGESSMDTSTVLGKSFEMILSPLGRELDLSGAEIIAYKTSQGNQSMTSSFQTIFPDVAGNPVKIGDSWTTRDTITDSSGGMELRINLESLNILEGIETVKGMECVKIKADVTGTVEGEGEQQGMNITFEGDVHGTDTWYFAYKEGVYVKGKSDVIAEMTLQIAAPMKMTVPMTRDMKMEITLIE
jgi:hypothetical protein